MEEQGFINLSRIEPVENHEKELLIAFTNIVSDSLASGEPGCGTFDVRHEAARETRNPKAGEPAKFLPHTTYLPGDECQLAGRCDACLRYAISFRVK
ncbi:MAG: HU family DNA-binding protein [Dethiobacter sp.]|nr:HU family DNA-binding protein [Dethiobacter sp.]